MKQINPIGPIIEIQSVLDSLKQIEDAWLHIASDNAVSDNRDDHHRALGACAALRQVISIFEKTKRHTEEKQGAA